MKNPIKKVIRKRDKERMKDKREKNIRDGVDKRYVFKNMSEKV
jgi:hypothetical protein